MKESLRSRQRGFNLLKLFIPVIVVAVFASILMEESPAPGNDARPAKPPTPAGPAYALGLKDNWPPMPEGKNAGAITDAAGMARANYYLILDGSGSMNDEQCSEGRRKIQVAVDAINAFTRALPKQSNFGLATFINSKNIELAPLGPDHQAGMASLGKVRPSGNTPLFSAVQFGYDKLTTQARRQSGYGEYHLVVVTDGMHSKGEDPTPAVDQLIARSPVVIHTIGFCISDNHALNQPGRTFYRSATDPASLKQGLESVLAEAPNFNIDRFEQ